MTMVARNVEEYLHRFVSASASINWQELQQQSLQRYALTRDNMLLYMPQVHSFLSVVATVQMHAGKGPGMHQASTPGSIHSMYNSIHPPSLS